MIFFAEFICRTFTEDANEYLQLLSEKTWMSLKAIGWRMVHPVSKTLACNVIGMGAMAHVVDIISYVDQSVEEIKARRRSNKAVVRQLRTSVAKLNGDWRQIRKRAIDENRQFHFKMILCFSLIPLSVYAFHRVMRE